MANKHVIDKINKRKFAIDAGVKNEFPSWIADDTVVLLRNVSKTYRVFKNKTDIFINVFKKKEHKVVRALRNINIEVKKGEVIGLIGYNGSGKTTLLKVVSSIITPDVGSEVYVKGSIGTMIALGTGFVNELTGRENIYYRAEVMGIPKEVIEERVEKIIAYSDLGDRVDDPVETYSSGMRARLGFSYYSFIDPDIMIVDEVTAVGDIRFKAKARKTITEMFRSGKTIFFVSHNMDEIEAYCTRAFVLRNGRIVDEGDPAELVAKYKEGKYLTKKVRKKRRRKLRRLRKMRESEEYKDVQLDDLLDKDKSMTGVENEKFFLTEEEREERERQLAQSGIEDFADDSDYDSDDELDVDSADDFEDEILEDYEDGARVTYNSVLREDSEDDEDDDDDEDDNDGDEDDR